MKKALMIVAIIGIIVIAGSVLYYYVFFRTEIARADVRLQEQRLEIEKEKSKIEVDILELERKKLELYSQPHTEGTPLSFEQWIDQVTALGGLNN